MPRKLRFVPEESLVEITCRTLQGRFLLRPSSALNQIVLGVLARAQRLTDMKICAFVYLSNHCHLLLRVRDALQMAEFMRYVNSNLAREIARLHRWREKVWGRRYADIVVSHEPEAQLARLRYLLEQGVKERLVASPLHWPGASSTRALARGEQLRGLWIDRSEQYRARLRGASTQDQNFAASESLELSPLPCLEHLSEAQRQTLVRRLIREICGEAERERNGREVLGKKALLAQLPTDRPAHTPRTPAPRFHAIEPAVRKALEIAYRTFVLAYRQATDDLLRGLVDVVFPPGSFPRPGRFVPLRA